MDNEEEFGPTILTAEESEPIELEETDEEVEPTATNDEHLDAPLDESEASEEEDTDGNS